jgi:NAD(P)-dependent dehydrogenase (short-subunit alcohol dehydrogenase family)
MSSQPKVWFVTGASVGLGYELVLAVLARGDRIIATMRDPSKMKDAFPDSDNLRILKLDVTAGLETIRRVADNAVAFWGRVDVLVRLMIRSQANFSG